ncbi:MAG: OB-fold protein, partial [Pyrinomonadaceae bacterium]
MRTKFNFTDPFVFSIVFCVAFGCSTSNIDDRSNAVSKTRSDAAPVTVSIEAKQLANEFGENEARADHLYTGKTARIRGTVESVETIDG